MRQGRMLLLLCLLVVDVQVGLSQTTMPPSGGQIQPRPQSPSLGTLTIPNPFAPQAADIASTASGASAPQGTTVPSNQGKSFSTVGKGLPGMTGGPPLTAPTGAQDPTARYMRPPVLAPLFCDPSVNIPC